MFKFCKKIVLCSKQLNIDLNIRYMVAAADMSYARCLLTFDLQQPSTFVNLWTRWIARFDQYRMASGLSAESNAKQVSTFLYCLEEANDFLVTMRAAEADLASYNAICDFRKYSV